jgi:hypothetical protein
MATNAEKALKVQQLAAYFAQMGQGYNYFNPVAKTQSDALLGNSQSEIMRLNNEIAAKKAKKSGMGGAIGAGVGAGIGALGFLAGPVGIRTMQAGAALGGQIGNIAEQGFTPQNAQGLIETGTSAAGAMGQAGMFNPIGDSFTSSYKHTESGPGLIEQKPVGPLAEGYNFGGPAQGAQAAPAKDPNTFMVDQAFWK